jgi:hypothetical protein
MTTDLIESPRISLTPAISIVAGGPQSGVERVYVEGIECPLAIDVPHEYLPVHRQSGIAFVAGAIGLELVSRAAPRLGQSTLVVGSDNLSHVLTRCLEACGTQTLHVHSSQLSTLAERREDLRGRTSVPVIVFSSGSPAASVGDIIASCHPRDEIVLVFSATALLDFPSYAFQLKGLRLKSLLLTEVIQGLAAGPNSLHGARSFLESRPLLLEQIHALRSSERP